MSAEVVKNSKAGLKCVKRVTLEDKVNMARRQNEK